MRVYGNPQSRWANWLTALVIFFGLVALIQVLERRGPDQDRILQQRFAVTPAAGGSGTIPLPPIPTNMIELARTTTARLLGGQSGAPLNTVAQNETLRVQIASIKTEGEALRLTGNVSNIGSAPASVALDAFKFIDASGTVYASSGGPSTTLQPGQSAPLDITLPIANPTMLRLEVDQPNQGKIELQLLNTPPTPTP